MDATAAGLILLMNEKPIMLKAVRELLGLRFYIPNYQRGYRWTEVQVKDLLNDIDDFMTKRSSEYYCLQPLVVKETIADVDDFLKGLPKVASESAETMLRETRQAISSNSRWEVIDGQQRLTTIFIILSYLRRHAGGDKPCPGQDGLFEITYQTRADSRDFLNRIADRSENAKAEEKAGKETGTDTESGKQPIDFHFMSKAYSTVEDWFKNKTAAGAPNESEYKKSFARTLLEDVRFIWYETDEKSTVVFKRLNMGKIGLTNAELVKALILNKANFKNREEKRIIIASQWDEFEYTLQNDEFWLFIHSVHYDKPTRIEFIFDLMCELGTLDSFVTWAKDKKTDIGTDKYRTFRYFNAYFESFKEDYKGLTPVELCWNKVKEIFRIFEEWNSDLEFYHYVGFLINEGVKVSELLKEWLKNDGSGQRGKDAFLEYLVEKIKKVIAPCKDLDKKYEVEKKTECRPLLLLHNIQSVVDCNNGFRKKKDYKLGVFYKFPFHLYKKESWNVEHIDSNTTNELDTKTEQDKWLKVSWCFLSEEKNKDLRNRIMAYVASGTDDKEEFGKIQSEILSNFEEKGALDAAGKNQIKNYVLLDEHTNKSYGNSIFPMKRMVISGKDRGVEYEIVKTTEKDKESPEFKITKTDMPVYKTAFVPPVTKSVFMKEYNPLSSNPYSWDVTDAEAYKDNIKNTLKIFLD